VASTTYAYRVRDRQGKLVNGTLTGDSEQLVLGRPPSVLAQLERLDVANGVGLRAVALADRFLDRVGERAAAARLAQPLDRPVGILLRFFLEHMLVRNRDRDLRLHLQQLVLHVENHLLDHRRRVLRPVDEIVQVCPDQRAHAF